MRHYAFNVGDYAAATAHLSDAEDLVYRRLLDAYYARETPLPTDEAALKPLCRVVKWAGKAWTVPGHEWCRAKVRFAILFCERFTAATA